MNAEGQKREGKHNIIIRLFSNFYVCVLPKEAPGSHFQMSWSGKCKFVNNTPEEQFCIILNMSHSGRVSCRSSGHRYHSLHQGVCDDGNKCILII